jgi:hypothetical protein
MPASAIQQDHKSTPIHSGVENQLPILGTPSGISGARVTLVTDANLMLGAAEGYQENHGRLAALSRRFTTLRNSA